ncbi:MAG TPA: hypothetical protein VF789_02720 [Thermoanaerobaculia bacterium]
MTEARSTRPDKSKTQEEKKNDDLGDDKVQVTTVTPTPTDPAKPTGHRDDQPKQKRI